MKEKLRAALKNDLYIGPILPYLQDPGKPRTTEVQAQLANLEYKEDLVFHNGLIYVPDDPEIKLKIMHERHDSPVSGHLGQAKTYELVSRNYFWPRMRKYINDYVTSCDTCNRSKNPRHKPYGELQPLPIPSRPWSSISMDFIIGLPASCNFTAILVVVDRLTKMGHFIPTTNEVDAAETALLFVQNVFKLHGLPDEIITDRGSIFTSRFWSRLMELLDIKSKLSTAYHPQTDGQTERVNQTLEQYLRTYCNYQQDDWSNLLPLAEFCYNNSTHATTGKTPFYANLGYNPEFTVTITDDAHSKVPAAEIRAREIIQIQEELVKMIAEAQKNYEKYYNMKVKPQPNLNIGDRVWLIRRHIKTSRPSDKLDYKRLGPFKILEKIGSRAFKLDLPAAMKIHPVFHISLLEPFKDDNIVGRIQPPPPPVQIDGSDEYLVCEILDSRLHRNKLEYFVDWEGYGPESRTWEPAANVANAEELVEEFHRRHPGKPRFSPSRRARR